MNKEESLEFLQRAFHAQKTGEAPAWNPQFAGAIETAIEVLIVEVTKQKMKKWQKEKK